MFGRKDTKPHVPARVKAFGRARLEIAQRAQSRQDWETFWKPPMQVFPFEWGPHWKQCIEYKVDDFAAEVGFLIDVLGLPVNAFNPDYAMFTSPDQEFYFAVVAAGAGMRSTPSDALRIQFMVSDIFSLAETLNARGVQLDREPSPVAEGSAQWVASFRTPHGISIEIWGLVEMVPVEAPLPSTPAAEDEIEPPEFEEEKTQKPSLSFLEDTMINEDEALESDSASEEDVPVDDGGLLDEEDDEAEEENPPKPYESSSHQWSYGSQVKAAEPVSDMENMSPQNGNQKPVRLLPRSAVEPAPRKLENMDPPSFRPAPKTNQEKKPASIWDEVAQDVEYLDLESAVDHEADSVKEPSAEYHYKPIPLNRD